jgi:hypothetical protein
MKLYLTNNGVAHVELSLDEITEIQIGLGLLQLHRAIDPNHSNNLAQKLHARISALIVHWLAGAKSGAAPREPYDPDTPRTQPEVQRTLALDSQAESHKPA